MKNKLFKHKNVILTTILYVAYMFTKNMYYVQGIYKFHKYAI
jgi:hypothetical protein